MKRPLFCNAIAQGILLMAGTMAFDGGASLRLTALAAAAYWIILLALRGAGKAAPSPTGERWARWGFVLALAGLAAVNVLF